MGSTSALAIGGAGVFALLTGLLWRSSTARQNRENSRSERLTLSQRLALIAIYASLMSTLVLRGRSTTDIASNPLDAAGNFRVLMLALALASAGLAILARTERGRVPPIPGPVWLFAAYTVVVLAGATQATARGFVMFRFFELATFLTVWLGAYVVFQANLVLPLKHVLAFVGLMAGSALVGVVVFGSDAIINMSGPIPFRIRGVMPQISANSVGFFGMLLYAFALGGVWKTRKTALLLGALGVALVLLTQYRTGYVGVAAITFAWGVSTRRLSAGVSAALAIPLGWALVQTARFEELWLRGAPDHVVQTLTGRTGWWGAALETWERSPLVGVGLSSGTRFDVFADIGRDTTSSIHSTWVEALLGTGLLGVCFLGASFVMALAVSFRSAWLSDANLTVLLLTAIGVRSLTGSTIELGGLTLLLFLVATSTISQLSAGTAGARTRAAPPIPPASTSGRSPFSLARASNMATHVRGST